MLRILADRVAIQPLKDPSHIGRIIIPETAKQMVDQGIVIYRGKDVKEVKVGDHVFFSSYEGQQVNIENEGFFFIMSEDAVTAILDEEHSRCPTCGHDPSPKAIETMEKLEF